MSLPNQPLPKILSARGKTNGKDCGAFTLVEMLTAITILSLMVLMISSLMNSASATIAGSNKRLGADGEVRMVFDRMQMDFARMLKRGDVWFQFTKNAGNAGNDEFSFYSETPGFFAGTPSPSTESNVSLVSYQIPTSGYNPNGLPATQPNQLNQLNRGSEGCSWLNPVSFSPTTAPASIPAADFHVISSSIFRMEVAFLVRLDDTHVQITSTPPTPGTQAFQNFYAVIVALGALDPNSQKLVNNYPPTSLINALHPFAATETIALNGTSSTPNAATIDPILSTWQSALNASNFAQTAGIPQAAAQQVRIYQRIFYLQ